VERAEAEAIYDAGREAVVEVLLAMDRRIQQLEARVEKLERQLSRSSRNSSRPPSSDPPGSTPKRGKDSAGRRPGAQSRHEGHGRELLPLSAVDEVAGEASLDRTTRAVWRTPGAHRDGKRRESLVGRGKPEEPDFVGGACRFTALAARTYPPRTASTRRWVSITAEAARWGQSSSMARVNRVCRTTRRPQRGPPGKSLGKS
jgi:hypothetical protein